MLGGIIAITRKYTSRLWLVVRVVIYCDLFAVTRDSRRVRGIFSILITVARQFSTQTLGLNTDGWTVCVHSYRYIL